MVTPMTVVARPLHLIAWPLQPRMVTAWPLQPRIVTARALQPIAQPLEPMMVAAPATAAKEGGEHMDGDGWSFGAFWVLLTKHSFLNKIGVFNGNGNCNELDDNGEIQCSSDGNGGVNGDGNGNGLDCDGGLNGNGNGNELDGDGGIDGNGNRDEGLYINGNGNSN